VAAQVVNAATAAFRGAEADVPNAQTSDAHAEGWRAELRLRFGVREARTYLVERAHRGPLLVQRPFYPEGNTCHTYIVHPPGGVVGGDRLTLDVGAESGSSVLITTPAAGKFYRSSGGLAQQVQTIRAAEAALEWLPQETIFYPGAQVRSDTRVYLERGARFIGWEIACFGLPTRQAWFDAGSLRLALELCVDGMPKWIDRLRVDGGSPARTAIWGLGGFNAVGTLLVHPASRAHLEVAREVSCERTEMAATLVDDVLVCRVLGAHAEPVRERMVRIWQLLRPQVLQRAASVPRIWST
jgi:urease accessory protein